MNRILLAGATGYLGSYIHKELENQNYKTRIITRQSKPPENLNAQITEVIKAEITVPDSLINICSGIDTVISTVGITRQKDGLTYMDVDYKANMNLLNESLKNGVKKFIYVSVLNGDKLKHLKICEAKEKFVDKLKSSGIDYCIIRPNGFFSDITEFYNMAKKGRVYLFGDGKYRSNPIHGEDLAKKCVESIKLNDTEILIGGPETLTQIEIAETAFMALNKEVKITFIPDLIRKISLNLTKVFAGKSTYGPIEFFMNVMAMDMLSPEYGTHTLKRYFESLAINEL